MSDQFLHPAHRPGLQILSAKPVPNTAFPDHLHQLSEGAHLWMLYMVLSASSQSKLYSRWKMLCSDELIPEHDQSVESFWLKVTSKATLPH